MNDAADIPLTPELRLALVKLAGSIPVQDLVSWGEQNCAEARKGLKSANAFADAVRKNIAWRIESDAGPDAEVLSFLEQFGLQRNFLCVLSEMAISVCFNEIILNFGEEAVLAGLYLDDRESVRSLAANHLNARSPGPFTDADPSRARALAEMISPFLEHARPLIQSLDAGGATEPDRSAKLRADCAEDAAALRSALNVEKNAADQLRAKIEKLNRQSEAQKKDLIAAREQKKGTEDELRDARRDAAVTRRKATDLEKSMTDLELSKTTEIERRVLAALRSSLRPYLDRYTQDQRSPAEVARPSSELEIDTRNTVRAFMARAIDDTPDDGILHVSEWLIQGRRISLISKEEGEILEEAVRRRMARLYDESWIKSGRDEAPDHGSRLRRRIDAGAALIVMVDGHNVIWDGLAHRYPGVQDEPALRNMLIHRVRDFFLNLPHVECRLSFDGPSATQERIAENILINYSGGSRSEAHRADHRAILPDLAYFLSAGAPADRFLVTNDRDLAKEAIDARAIILGSAEFLDLIGY